MMEKILIQNSQLIIGAALVFFSSIVTLLITNFFDSRRSKQERLFDLNKYIYFNLQNKGEEIITGLTVLKRRVEGMKIAIDKNTIIKFEDDFLENRLKIVSCLEIFFLNVDPLPYDKGVSYMRKLAEIYVKFYQGSKLSTDDIRNFNNYYSQFHKNMGSIVKDIKETIYQWKNNIQ